MRAHGQRPILFGRFAPLAAALIFIADPGLWGGAAIAAGSSDGKAKYYFKVMETRSVADTPREIRDAARELLEKELAGRPEFTSDLGDVVGVDLASALTKHKLDGFSLFLKIEELKTELKAPRPGGRLKQLALNVRVSVVGVTLPGEKLSFTGEGEAGTEAEVVERRIPEEKLSLTREVMTQAIKQAVDQAVGKLGAPKSVPFNEIGRKRKKK